MKKIEVLTIILITSVLLFGCKADDKSDDIEVESVYETSLYELPPPADDCSVIREHVFESDEVIYLSVLYGKGDDQYLSRLYSFDTEAELTGVIDLADTAVIFGVCDSKFIGQNLLGVIDAFDSKSGEVLWSTDRVNEYGMIRDMITLDGSIYILAGEYAIQLDRDGNIISTIKDGILTNPVYSYPLYDHNDKPYVSIIDGCGVSFYELDFDEKCCITSGSFSDQKTNIMSYNASFIVEEDRIKSIDIDNCTMNDLLNYNYTDVRPISKALRGKNTCIIPGLGYEVVSTYYYMDGSIDIQFSTKVNKCEDVSVQTIVIGGYSVSQDLYMQWARYIFNTTNQDYRIIFDDYSDQFGYGTGEEAEQARLRLVAYFEDGNSPDIFYGNDFDYEYWGRIGMVDDLYSFICDIDNFDESDLTPSVRDLMIENGMCFSVFPAYSLNGYWTMSDNVSELPENGYSIGYLEQISDEMDISITSELYANDIADYMIRYNLTDLFMDDRENLDNDIKNILLFSVDHGVYPSGGLTEFANIDSVLSNKYLMYMSYIGSPIHFLTETGEYPHVQFTYIGFPSSRGSSRLINPVGATAISSSSDHKAQCQDFLRILLTDRDLQKLAIVDGQIPVNESILELYCEYLRDPDLIPVEDEHIRRYLEPFGPVTEELVTTYIDAINSVDTIIHYDWGVYNIISEEVATYYTENKTIESIADVIITRIDLYLAENAS